MKHSPIKTPEKDSANNCKKKKKERKKITAIEHNSNKEENTTHEVDLEINLEKDTSVIETPDKAESNKTEKTIELLLSKNGSKYLVKWKNLSSDENSWEPRTAIPSRILNVRIYH